MAKLTAKHIRAGYKKHPRSRSLAMRYANRLAGRGKAAPRKPAKRKGTKSRVRMTSTGIRRGPKTIGRLSRRSPYICATGVRKVRRKTRRRRKSNPSPNPTYRRRRRTARRNPRFTRRTARAAARKRWAKNPRKRRTSRRRRRNPLGLGTFTSTWRQMLKTLTTPQTYIDIGIVGLAAMGAVAITKWGYSQIVDRFVPQLAAYPMVNQVLVSGLAVVTGGLVARYVTKRPDLRKGIVMASGVLAAAGLIRGLVAQVSPTAAGYLGYYSSALPAPRYVGDWVSPDTGLGDWVSPDTGLGGCNPLMGCNPNLYQSYGGLGFVPQFDEIPGEIRPW